MAGLSRFAVRRRAGRVLALPIVLALLAWSGVAAAQAPSSVENQVKAAYLFKFAGFVEWPDGAFARADSPLQIGVSGNDALADQLEQMVAGRTVGGHAISVRKLRRGDAVSGIHMLFIGAGERAAVIDMLAAARGQSVLTVSDADDSIALGCMIAFVVAQDRLRFDVALGQVNSSRLRISARMLAAANRVQGAS
ncbi:MULTISPECIES: YfiR family protein [Massilia]|uniref:YfiR family protein n=2 Tax=Massilia TaxID=149698 RepID=A0ABY4A9K7_9BURK|nr:MULTISPECIES: YfiR family protein [Massilia]NHZ38628.1 YfiR family protein [Massilia aquatica]UOD31489.1 YfiR family protein [Massilia violaceinigra]